MDKNAPNTEMMIQDYGPRPLVVNMEKVSEANPYFRTALWTGHHLQLTLMSIKVGEDIGQEMHPHVDQFIRVEDGSGMVKIGYEKDQLVHQYNISNEYGVIIPAGTWHNIINTGDSPLKLSSIYAPVQHPFGTIHQTKEDAMKAEHHD